MRIKTGLILLLTTTFVFISCSKKVIPGLDSAKPGKDYDAATFNYLFVESVRLKLMGNQGDALLGFQKCISADPGSDASYFQIGQILLGNGDVSNGKKYIRKASELQPGNIWYNMLLGNIYQQQNNLDSAIICYERAVKSFPEKSDLQLTLAKLYSANKNYEKSGKILEKFDSKFGPNEATIATTLENLLSEGKYTEAKEKVQKLLITEPDNIGYNGYLASVYRAMGDKENAKEVYRQLIQRNPANPAIQLSLVDFLLSEKSYDELFDLLNTVLLNEQITRQEKVSLIAELIENEDLIKSQGPNLEVSIRVLEAAFPNDDLISLLRPELLQKENKNVQAADRLEEMIMQNPDNYYAWEKLLMVYYSLKDFTMLQKRGEECATKFNRSPVAKLLYASAAMENKNFELALDELRKTDILAGDNKDLKLQVMTMRADVYYRMRNYTEAFKAYDDALKLNNSDLTILNNYAYYLAEQNMRLKDAEAMAKTVIEKDKENKTFLDTYAWVLYKRNKAKDARKIMEKIISSENENDAEYFEHYGFILKKLGKCKEAVSIWEKALLLDATKEGLKKEIENCRK